MIEINNIFMALRDLPYIPLYIQDVLTDEKLIECSANAHGVYFRLICILHKQDDYGKLLLKQKDKQTSEHVENFAMKLTKQLPFAYEIILQSLKELLLEKVLYIENDFLIQKRMVNDGALSEQRAVAGNKGGVKTQKKLKQTALNFAKANNEANTDTEIEVVTENKIEVVTEIVLPFQNENFKLAWNVWLAYRKEIKKPYKSNKSIEAALKQLSTFDADFCIILIDRSIANGWQGLIYDKTQNEFLNYKKNGQQIGTQAGKQHPLANIKDLASRILQNAPEQNG